MVLDFGTLNKISTVFSIFSAIIMLIVWRINPDEKGPGLWFLASLMALILKLSSRYIYKISENFLQVTVIVIVLIYTLVILEGVLRFRKIGHIEKRFKFGVFAIIVILVLAILTKNIREYQLLFNDFAHAIILLSTGIMLVYNTKRKELVVMAFISSFFFLLAVLLFYRFFLLIFNIPFTNNYIISLIYLFYILWGVGWTFGLSLAVNLRSREELTKSEIKLQNLNFFKDRIFQTISHDLRIPVNQFRSLLAVFNSTNSENCVADRYYNEISESVENADLLLENLFGFGKNYMASVESKKSPVSMVDLIKSLLEYEKQLIKQKQLVVLTKYEEDIVVFADYQFILTVLRNLFSNAVKFSPTGGKIIISYEINSLQVKICIQDSGTGISAEVVKAIANNEVVISPSPDSFGKVSTGHGLFICNYFLKYHNSKLIFRKEEEGSGVSFSLERYLV